MKITKLLLTNSSSSNTLWKTLSLTNGHVTKYFRSPNINLAELYAKLQSLNNWYTRVIGLDEVKASQDRVALLQDQLLSAQEKRRSIGTQLAEIRKKSNELQDQIHKVKRQEDLQKFLDLMREETEILKMEGDASRIFYEQDRLEREIFTAFTDAVRDAHQKQRTQLEYTKYFGITLSIIGSLLTFAYSMIRKEDLKKCIEENIQKVGSISQPLVLKMEKTQTGLQQVLEELSQDNNLLKGNRIKRKVLGYFNLVSEKNGDDFDEIGKIISAPVLSEIRKQQRELWEIKKLLKNRGDVGGMKKGNYNRTLLNSSHEEEEVWYSSSKIIYTCIGLFGAYILVRSIGG